MINKILSRLSGMSAMQKMRLLLIAFFALDAIILLVLGWCGVLPEYLSGALSALSLGLMLITNGISLCAKRVCARSASSVSFVSGGIMLLCAVFCAVVALV